MAIRQLHIFDEGNDEPEAEQLAPNELRSWPELAKAIDWSLGADVWRTSEALEALLRLVNHDAPMVLIRDVPPERIVLSYCYVRAQELKGQKIAHPGSYLNTVARAGASKIMDYRAQILPRAKRDIEAKAIATPPVVDANEKQTVKALAEAARNKFGRPKVPG